MADFVFNNSLGAAAEKVRNTSSALLVLLLTSMAADATARDYDDVAALLDDGSTNELGDASYSRKTGLTGTITIDDSNERVDVDIPDQTWSGLSGTDPTDLVIAVEESASDSGRETLTSHDFAVTTDGSDVTAQFAASGFYRAS